jgi:hypothetical protein
MRLDKQERASAKSPLRYERAGAAFGKSSAATFLDDTSGRIESGRLGIYSCSSLLVAWRAEPAPGEQVDLRARLSMRLGSSSFGVACQRPVESPSTVNRVWRHRYFPSLPKAIVGGICRESRGVEQTGDAAKSPADAITLVCGVWCPLRQHPGEPTTQRAAAHPGKRGTTHKKGFRQ